MLKSENSLVNVENSVSTPSISKLNLQETKSRERSSHLLNNSNNRIHDRNRLVLK